MNKKQPSFALKETETPLSLSNLSNEKILKAIHNKMTPLIMNPRVKLSIERENEKSRPTFNEFSYHIDGKNEKRKNQNWYEQKNSRKEFVKSENLSLVIQEETINNKLKKTVAKSVKVRNTEGQNEDKPDLQKMKRERFPEIVKHIQKRKQKFVKQAQKDLLLFQKDNFRPDEEKQTYNLQYLLNRLNIHKEMMKKKIPIQFKKQQIVRGYQNLSPNNIPQYIDYFKQKVKKIPQSIYISKKRIALPKSNTEGDQEEQREKENFTRHSSFGLVKDGKKDKMSKKELRSTKKNLNMIETKSNLFKAKTSQKMEKYKGK